jgi:membrane-bound lytic murein transglycosylase B
MTRSCGRRTVFSILCFLSCVLVLLGCSSKEGQIKEDLSKYMDEARLWAAAEAQINNAIATVRRDQFVHDDLVAETLKPAVGVAQKYIEQLENYHPRTPPLYNVHQEYIEAWRAHYFAMAAVVDAVEKKDYIQLAKANNDLLEAQRSVSDALADLARLLREAGLRPDQPADQPPPAPPGEGFEVAPSSPS